MTEAFLATFLMNRISTVAARNFWFTGQVVAPDPEPIASSLYSLFEKSFQDRALPDPTLGIPVLPLPERLVYIWNVLTPTRWCDGLDISFVDDWRHSLRFISLPIRGATSEAVFSPKIFSVTFERYQRDLHFLNESYMVGGFGSAWNSGNVNRVTGTISLCASAACCLKWCKN